MFWYWKSKKSIITSVSISNAFIKNSFGITKKKINFKSRVIKSNSDFYSSAYWEPVYTKTIQQSNRVCKLIAWSVYLQNAALTMPILLLLRYFYINKSVIYRVLQSKHILHIIREDIKINPKHSRKNPTVDHRWDNIQMTKSSLCKYKVSLPFVDSRKWAAFCCGNHLILLIFSSISRLFK